MTSFTADEPLEIDLNGDEEEMTRLIDESSDATSAQEAAAPPQDRAAATDVRRESERLDAATRLQAASRGRRARRKCHALKEVAKGKLSRVAQGPGPGPTVGLTGRKDPGACEP